MIRPGITAPLIELRWFFNNSGVLLAVVLALYTSLLLCWLRRRTTPVIAERRIGDVFPPTAYVTAWLVIPFE